MKKLVSGLMLSTSVLGVAAPMVTQSTVFAETADTSTKTTEMAKPAQVILAHVTEGGKSLKANEVIAKDVKSGDKFSQEVTFSDITDDKGLVWEFKELKRVNRTTDSTSTDTKTNTSTTDTKTSTTDTKTSTTDTKTSTTDTKSSTTDTKISTTDTKSSTADTKSSTADTKSSTTDTKTSTSKTDATKPATTEADTTQKGGSVTIKYVDAEGKEIHKVVTDEIAGWPIGKAYDTTENKLSNIRFDGKDYVFKEVKGNEKGNEKGTITKDNQVVTYVYALKSEAGASTPTDTKPSTSTADAKAGTTDAKPEDSSVKKTVSGTLTAGDNIYQAVYAPKMAKITYKFEGDLPKEVLAQLPKVNTKQVGSKFTVAKVQKETVKVGKVTYTFKGWDTSALNSDVKAEGEDAELEVPVLKVEADETPVYSGSTPSLTPSTTDADKTDGTSSSIDPEQPANTADTTDAEQPVEEVPVTALLTGDVTIVGTWDKTEDEPSGSLGSTSDKTDNSDADSNATTDADTNTSETTSTDTSADSNAGQSSTQGTSNAVPSSNESAPAAKPTTFAKTGAKIAGGVFAAVAALGLGSLFVVNRKKQK